MDAADIDEMVHQYAGTALWSTTDTTCQIDPDGSCDSSQRPVEEHCDACKYGGEPLDALYTVDDIAPETMAQFREDCAAFYETCADDLTDMEAGQAGHDFWLTRNGHGAGFWDRGLGERGERLSEIARPYGSVNLYVSDGKVWGQ
jgi:hypothetical protein